MTFLIDNQLPVALVHFFTDKGAECEHVLDIGLAQATDAEIWRVAGERQMILVSKDEDFFHLAAREDVGVGLIWVRLGNCRTRALLSAMEKAWPRIKACLEAKDRVVELR